MMGQRQMKDPAERKNEQGFTLVELMVALLISAVVMTGIFMLYRSQQRSYVMQDEVAAMQQNLRSALYFMGREIRMAGCDPTGMAGAGFTVWAAGQLGFTMDTRGKDEDDPPDKDTSDPNETVTYTLADGDGDGSADDLVRNTGGGNQLVAENIAVLNFTYLDDQGNVAALASQIRSVQITLRARTEQRYGTEKTKTVTTTIKCRNLGLGI